MVRFACRCKNVVQAPDDQAGLTVQCDKCGLLLDVPLLSDARSLEKDGTYKLSETNTAKPDLAELQKVFYPGTKLPDGSEIDLRGPVVPLRPIEPQDPGAPPPRERPKYDPDTGELVRPLGVTTSNQGPRSKKLAEAHRVIDYNVSPDALEGSPLGLAIFASLFAPLNVIVMAIIIGCHLFLTLSIVVTMALLITFPIPLAVVIFIASHYASVVEETGLWEKDELPRPLRNVHLWDDLLAPFARTVLALAICYWPMAVVLLMNYQAAMARGPLPFPAAGLWLLGLFALGSALFPAIFLTICTSGTLVNLAPGRILGTVHRIGWIYLFLVFLWVAAAGTYLAGVLATVAHAVGAVVISNASVPLFARSYVAYPLLMLGVYLAHALCWYLGVTYRKHHNVFPWAAQQHQHRRERVTVPLHPTLTAAEEQARQRASRRPRSIR